VWVAAFELVDRLVQVLVIRSLVDKYAVHDEDVIFVQMNRHIVPLLSAAVVAVYNNSFEQVARNKPMVILDNCILVEDTYTVDKS
jgi:hypothetical protein